MSNFLFDLNHPDMPAAQRHSPTSVDAAAEIAPKAETLRGKVLAFIRSQPDGATDEQIIDGLEMGGSTARPRRIELVALRLVKDSGRTRKTRAGKSAVVWVAV